MANTAKKCDCTEAEPMLSSEFSQERDTNILRLAKFVPFTLPEVCVHVFVCETKATKERLTDRQRQNALGWDGYLCVCPQTGSKEITQPECEILPRGETKGQSRHGDQQKGQGEARRRGMGKRSAGTSKNELDEKKISWWSLEHRVL